MVRPNYNNRPVRRVLPAEAAQLARVAALVAKCLVAA
jgi:hypothetical protein